MSARPSKQTQRLDLLAGRVTPSLLGDASVHIRDCGPAGVNMWRIFENAYRRRAGRDEVQAPHSIATTALRALTGGYVWLDAKRAVLASQEPIDDDTIRDVFTLLHGLAMGDDIDDIDLNQPVGIADKFASTTQEQRALADYLLRSPSGQPDAPSWVYQTVAWDLARRIAAEPWAIDGLSVRLRPDTAGGLVAWDDPWPDENGTRFSLPRIRLQMKTEPNVSDPLILVSASATRINRSMDFTRTVLAEQDHPDRPLVEVELDGRGRLRNVNRLALQALSRLGMGRSVLHEIDRQIQADRLTRQRAQENGEEPPTSQQLGTVRPIMAKNFYFPVGSGVGMDYYRGLYEHIQITLGDHWQPLHGFFEGGNFKQAQKADVLMDPLDITRSLEAMGLDHLRIVCLWATDEVRQRMINALALAYGLDPTALNPAEGKSVTLHGTRISAVFQHVPEFLQHGPATGRSAHTADLLSLKTASGEIVGVWAETEYGDGKKNSVPRPKDSEDAKHQTHRILAKMDLVVQYIDRAVQTGIDKSTGMDHQSLSCLMDLYRNLGFIDRRVSSILTKPIGEHPADGVAHCGVHVRRQSRRPGERDARIVVSATVLKPPTVVDGAWTLHGWSYTDRVWKPYHLAEAAFHAADYPAGKMTEFMDNFAGHSSTAKVIDQALEDLADYLDGTPYTVTVDGVACRRLWKGLNNKAQGQPPEPNTTWLPGSTIAPRFRPIAVIRLNTTDEEVPRPVQVTITDEDDTEIKTKERTTQVFRIDPDLGKNSTWFLVNTTHQFDGNGAGRQGSKKTRWSALPWNKGKNEIKANYCAMTATEIFPIAVNTDHRRELTMVTARLCHQALAWKHRTRYPIALHAALQMDKDHPQFRRTVAPDDLEDETNSGDE
ncbi:RNaseH domain-containing protein [Streptomyces sp. CBMA123]|uniref:RNaseH domain-containing protein n=1 Tax=Streptomyces sp. CBMA123 TaxID=1896313 RepID=UPI001661FECE|nr:RNaseH domain-containing protein [Streptomyces sp. CBMA123]